MSNKKEVFRESIKKTFDQWQTLKIALSHSNMSVNDFLNWLVDSTETFFYENDGLNGDEVADWLDEIVDTELDVQVRDGTLEQVGQRLCTYFNLINQNELEKVSQLLSEPAPPPAPVSYNAQNDSDDDDSD